MFELIWRMWTCIYASKKNICNIIVLLYPFILHHILSTSYIVNVLYPPHPPIVQGLHYFIALWCRCQWAVWVGSGLSHIVTWSLQSHLNKTLASHKIGKGGCRWLVAVSPCHLSSVRGQGLVQASFLCGAMSNSSAAVSRQQSVLSSGQWGVHRTSPLTRQPHMAPGHW